MEDLSSNWKKPSEVMKIRKIKSYQNFNLFDKAQKDSLVINTETISKIKTGIKRKNPFGSTNVFNTSDKVSIKENFFEKKNKTCLDLLMNISNPQESKKEDHSFNDSKYNSGLNEINHKISEKYKLHHEDSKKTKIIPMDWSIKTKARFITTKPLDCLWPIRGVDECNGIALFVSSYCNLTEPVLNDQNKSEITSTQHLQKCLMYWIHPYISWLPMFPRFSTSNNKLSPNSFQISKEIEQCFQKEWCESMNSCYQNIRNEKSSYMYLYCLNYTVIFFAASKENPISASVTPTTKGFRKSIREEGIEYSLPFIEQIKYDVNRSKIDNINENANLEESKLTEQWLEDIECNKKQYTGKAAIDILKELEDTNDDESKVDENLINAGSSEDFRKIDYRSTSTIVVEDNNVQALFNYLLNSTNLKSNVGPYAGIPPTILSCSAFKGATLQSLKISNQGEISCLNSQTISNNTKISSNINNKFDVKSKKYFMDITGPIMPNSFRELINLFSQSYNNYQASFTVHEPTIPFNRSQLGLVKVNFKNDKKLDLVLESEQNLDNNKDGNLFNLNNIAIKDIEFEDDWYSFFYC